LKKIYVTVLPAELHSSWAVLFVFSIYCLDLLVKIQTDRKVIFSTDLYRALSDNAVLL